MHGAIGFGFASHWLKNWHEAFEPTTKRNNRNHVITLDSHLKTALLVNYHFLFFRVEENSRNSVRGIEMCAAQKLTYTLGCSGYS